MAAPLLAALGKAFLFSAATGAGSRLFGGDVAQRSGGGGGSSFSDFLFKMLEQQNKQPQPVNYVQPTVIDEPAPRRTVRDIGQETLVNSPILRAFRYGR